MAVTAIVVAVGLAVSPTAGAQDPYGGTTTTTAGDGSNPSCAVNVTRGDPGDTVIATVFDVPPGTLVRVLFDGVEVARATSPAAQTATVDVQIPFTVPNVGPGSHTVTAVGETFNRACELAFDIGDTGGGAGGTDGTTGTAGTTGGTDTVVQPGTETPRGNTGGSGSLPRTGIAILLLLALAAALVLGGRAILDASRRRDRKAAHSASH